ncbi:hypothetical protein BD560DRAFT_384074 [Blakeslea trispora]|nr:hypothetical protein BD560DRAFT_384074 [Blakeslea trispora]
METLNEEQQHILQQYKLETKVKDTVEAIRILEENDWDLKVFNLLTRMQVYMSFSFVSLITWPT